MSITPKYSIASTSTGGGRDGHVRSADGQIDADLRAPKELGGPGNAANPELYFSAGWAACFNGALHAVARTQKIELKSDPEITVTVSLGSDNDDGGFGLAAEIDVLLAGHSEEEAREIAEKAHAFCPYSKATRGNIDVTLTSRTA